MQTTLAVAALVLVSSGQTGWPAGVVTLHDDNGVSCGGAVVDGPANLRLVATAGHCLKSDTARSASLESVAPYFLFETPTVSLNQTDIGFFEARPSKPEAGFVVAAVAPGDAVTLWPARTRISRRAIVLSVQECLPIATKYCSAGGPPGCTSAGFSCARFDPKQVEVDCGSGQGPGLTCKGDSGSPLTDSAGRLVGIHSGRHAGDSLFQPVPLPLKIVVDGCTAIEDCARSLGEGTAKGWTLMPTKDELLRAEKALRDLGLQLGLPEQDELLRIETQLKQLRQRLEQLGKEPQ